MASRLFRAPLARLVGTLPRTPLQMLTMGPLRLLSAGPPQFSQRAQQNHTDGRRASSNAAVPAAPVAPVPETRTPINFDDFKAAFQHHSTGELLRALLILNLCSFSVISSNSERIVTTLKRYFGKQVTGLAFTLLHRHFAGGQRFEDLSGTLGNLRVAGIGAILDYAAEADLDDIDHDESKTQHAHGQAAGNALMVPHPFFPNETMDATATADERELDANVRIFLECIGAAATQTNGFAAIKATALVEPDDLMALAQSCHAPATATNPIAALPVDQAARVHRCLARLDRIAQASHGGRVRLMVDAEQTYFQPGIDWLVRLLQRKYNVEWPAVFNTYQCYLVDSRARLAANLAFCNSNDIKFGAKLVRGAYLVQERSRAATMGYADPIHASIEATHTNYDQCVADVLPHLARGANVMVASHNEDSIKKTVAAMAKLQIPKDGGVFFGQLLGMADHVTYTLGAARYAIYKYVPYGPVYEVVAYLSRRVQENSSVTGGEPIRKARAMLRQELQRRILG